MKGPPPGLYPPLGLLAVLTIVLSQGGCRSCSRFLWKVKELALEGRKVSNSGLIADTCGFATIIEMVKIGKMLSIVHSTAISVLFKILVLFDKNSGDLMIFKCHFLVFRSSVLCNHCESVNFRLMVQHPLQRYCYCSTQN